MSFDDPRGTFGLVIWNRFQYSHSGLGGRDKDSSDAVHQQFRNIPILLWIFFSLSPQLQQQAESDPQWKLFITYVNAARSS